MFGRFFTWLGRVAREFCAAFLVFAAVLGAIGFAIALPFNAQASCWPHHSLFFVFVWSCEYDLAGAAWFGTVELARVVVALPALSLHYLHDTIRDWPYPSIVLEAMTWTVTVLTLLAVSVGFRTLRARVPAVAWGLLAMYAAQAAALAMPGDMSAPVQSACTKDDYSYSYFVTPVREPPLSCGTSTDDESYRFLWLPSFEGPVAIRVYRRGDSYGLVAVIFEYQDGLQPGGIKKRVHRGLSPAEWRQAVSMLEEVGFWRLKTNPDDTVGIDGTDYVIEGRRRGRYHIANRLGGLELEPVGELFLKLAGLGDGRR